MGTILKYLLMDNVSDIGDMESIVIFPIWGNHKIMANRLGKDHVISAGFVKLISDDGKVKVDCYGASTSLGIPSRPEDNLIVNSYMNNGE